MEEAKLDGVVATNTTIARAGLRTSGATVEAIGAGGSAGHRSARARSRSWRGCERGSERAMTVIGVGGIESADDVIAFVRAGANLVQLYTGFIYGGPLLPHTIARELSRRMDERGARSVAELVS